MNTTKRSILNSVTALALCFVMLLGTTFAWFTDVATSEGNVIKTGTLDIDLMKGTKIDADWYWESCDGQKIFEYENWEPGYTTWTALAVQNNGTLAAKISAKIVLNGQPGILGDVIDVYAYTDAFDDFDPSVRPDFTDGSWHSIGTVNEIFGGSATVLQDRVLNTNTRARMVLALHMREDAGNEYQDLDLGANFDIKILATQATYENDSFGDDYDTDATWPELSVNNNNTASAEITLNADNTLASETVMSNDDRNINVTIPAGVKFNSGVTTANLSVSRLINSGANITLGATEQSRSYDVHIEGVAADNDKPIAIAIAEFLPVGLNMGNYSLYHVENGQTVEMRLLAESDTPVHNSFTYDPLTGNVTLYLATFSEIALVADVDNAWGGNVDHSWYLNAVVPIDLDGEITYYIANADQLWSFSQIVGGMAMYENPETKEAIHIDADTFEGKTIKLMADINLGDDEANNNEDIIFYPIGYYNSEGTYEKGNTAITSGFRLFKGTFDGNGYTVANFYQNTWEMKGDHNWYAPEDQHYRDGMGLFGRVYGGTIRNLTINNFSCDGEITTTGCVAAYADHGALFENIAVINSNPRVYNIGNGGIVGVVGWYETQATDAKVTFRNITVDNTNKISALWGSWDVPCGGIVGTYYPTSGQSSAGYPANPGIHFENCHVGAQIDVNNDVCANYQYYAYRYAGMLMGMVYENVTGDDGRVYPKMDGIVAADCTIHFGTWNDYYYCELVDNSTASYTHDYQMSRLVEVKSVEGTTITPLKGESFTVPSSGRYNYVVVDYTKGHGTGNATCYHFLNGEVWTHDKGGTEIVNGEEVLKEDKQHLYLEFNNLVTGNGWGVTSKEIGDFDGVTILDRTEANSIEKFEGRKNANDKLTYPVAGREYKISHLFNLLETDVRVIPGALMVTVTNLDKDGNVSAEFTRSATSWADSTIVFHGNGKIRVTIQDYFYCKPKSIDLVVRSYPEGSIILNFTYDGFDSSDYIIPEAADEITTGKHGTYDYDFGFGPEVLDHALKIDSKGSITFNATSKGTLVIALASNTVGASLDYRVMDTGNLKGDDLTDALNKVKENELLKIHEANKLMIVKLDVSAGKTYQFIKGDNETAIYYIGYLPENAVNAAHECAYYETTTATCTSGGTTTRICLVCGKGTKYTVEALDHHYVDTEAYDSTCTSEGRTAGTHCVRCGDVQTASSKIDKKKHDYENDICINCGGLAANLHTFVNGVCTGCGTKIEDAQNSEFSYVISHSINFTTGKTQDYDEYRNYFLPRGICSIDGSGKYVIMKSLDNYESYIEFTVASPATLIVTAASTGRGNTTNFVLEDVSGNIISERNNRVQAVGVDGTTFIYTISEAGTYRFVCTSTDRVGRLMSMKIAENHTYTIETITKNPTCTEAGEKTLSCNCGQYITEVIPAAGHSFVDGVCSVCQAEDPTGCTHSNKTEHVVAPTCTTKGYTSYTCDDCNTVIKGEEIPATGHTEVVDAAVDPTCTETGLTAGSHCSACNKIFVAQEVVAKIAHNYGDGETCTVCGTAKPAEGTQVHSFTDNGDTDPEGFFTISGNLRGDGTLKLQSSAGSISFTPAADGKVTIHFIGATSLKVNGVEYDNVKEVDGIKTLTFAVKEGTSYEITKGSGEALVSYIEYTPGDFSDLEDPHTHIYVNGVCACGKVDPDYVAPHEHTYVLVVTAPTCTSKGYTTYTCSGCSDVKIDDETAALGHNWGEGSVTKAPSCSEKGVKTFECSTCHATKTEDVAALGHNYVDGVCDRAGCGAVQPSANDRLINFSNWDAFAKGKYADGDTVIYNDIFTFIYGKNSRVDSSSKAWDDFSGTNRFSFGGKTNDGVPTKNALRITTDGSYTIKIWYVAGGDGRYFELRDVNGEAIATTTKETKQNTQYYSELEITTAGVYYLTIPADNQYIYQIELVDSSTN